MRQFIHDTILEASHVCSDGTWREMQPEGTRVRSNVDVVPADARTQYDLKAVRLQCPECPIQVEVMAWLPTGLKPAEVAK